MKEKRLNEIRARLEGATPTDLEPTFRDEVWFIRHIEEIIKAYRQDIPDLLDALQTAEQQNAQLLEALVDLMERVDVLNENIGELDTPPFPPALVVRVNAAIAAAERKS